MNWTDEVKQALATATPGNWKIDAGVYFNGIIAEKNSRLTVVASNVEFHDTALLVNAPKWLSQLLQEREQMVKALKWYEGNGRISGSYARTTLKQVGELE